jgi:hypothetical protein
MWFSVLIICFLPGLLSDLEDGDIFLMRWWISDELHGITTEIISLEVMKIQVP